MAPEIQMFITRKLKDAMRACPHNFICLDHAKFHEAFAADLSPSQAKFLADSQQPVAAKGFNTPTAVPAWRAKPGYALLTIRNHALGPALQSWMYQRSGSKVTEVSSSHAVYISQPDAVAPVIQSAARQAN